MEMADKLVWKALSDPTRRELLDLLKGQPRTTGELCEAFGHLSRFAIMKHLRVLESAHLVVTRKHGRQRWNHLNAIPLRQIYDRWVSQFESEWAGSLLALKRITETIDSKPKEAVVNQLHVEQEVQIEAKAERVFEALTERIGAWWGPPYCIEGGAVILEAKLGGRLYEDWGDGQGALWGAVTQIKHNANLEITGSIGMSGAVFGVALFSLESKGKATILKFSHRAMGEVSETQKKNYALGWQDLLGTRLKNLVEKSTSLKTKS
jgi:DNA-binding transcriptional ArsR family regulator